MFQNSFNTISEWNPNRYSLKKFIGCGRYGNVYKGIDNVKQTDVALKSIEVRKSDGYKSIYKELCILRHNRSNYLLQLLDVQKSITDGNISILWLVLPLMEFDLFKMKNMYFSFEAIIKISFQILKGLQYLFEADIIHRDLKPSNIGLNSNYEVRILDFGMSREQSDDMTKNVQTLYYRAIEMFSHKRRYNKAIDIWSAGCIFYELFTRKPLFMSKTLFGHVRSILIITGPPSDQLYEDLRSSWWTDYQDKQLRTHIEKDILDFVCDENEKLGNRESAKNVIDLICAMLDLDATKRPTPVHAMNYALFHQYYDLVKHYPSDKVADVFKCNCDHDSNDFLQEKIVDLIKDFVPIL